MSFAASFNATYDAVRDSGRAFASGQRRRGLAKIDEEFEVMPLIPEGATAPTAWRLGDQTFTHEPPEYMVDALKAESRSALTEKWGDADAAQLDRERAAMHREKGEKAYREGTSRRLEALMYDDNGLPLTPDQVLRDPNRASQFLDILNNPLLDSVRNQGGDGTIKRASGFRRDPRTGQFVLELDVLDPETGAIIGGGPLTQNRSSDGGDLVVPFTAEQAFGLVNDHMRGVSPSYATHDAKSRALRGQRGLIDAMAPEGYYAPSVAPGGSELSPNAGAGVPSERSTSSAPGLGAGRSAPSTARSAPSVSGTVRGLGAELQQYERALNSPAPDAMAERLGLGGKDELGARVTALKGALEEQKKAYADPPESFKYKEAPTGAYSDEDAAAARIKAMEGFRKDVALSNALRPDGAALLEATGYDDLADLDAEIEHAKLIEQRLRQGGADRSLPEVPVRPGDAGLAQAGRQWEEVGFPGVGDGIPMGRATTGLGAANVWQEAEAEAPAPRTESPARESLIHNESGGNWKAKNDAKGAGGHVGHFGRLQFGQARMQDYMNQTGEKFTPEQFMDDPALQQRVEQWHFADIDRHIDSSGLTGYLGKTVGGTVMTREAMHAVAHLGGNNGLRKFLESGGRYNPADDNGTRLSDYAARHGGQSQAPRTQGLASGPSSLTPEQQKARREAALTHAALGGEMSEAEKFGRFVDTGSPDAPKAPSITEQIAYQKYVDERAALPGKQDREERKSAAEFTSKMFDITTKAVDQVYGKEAVERDPSLAGRAIKTLNSLGLDLLAGPEVVTPALQDGHFLTARINQANTPSFWGKWFASGTQYDQDSIGVAIAAAGYKNADMAEIREKFLTPVELLSSGENAVITNQSQAIEAVTTLSNAQQMGLTASEATGVAQEALQLGVPAQVMRYGLELKLSPRATRSVLDHARNQGASIQTREDFRRVAVEMAGAR